MTQGDGEHTQGGPLPATWIDTRVPVTSRESHRESERKVSESVALPSPSAFLPTNSRPERSKFFPQFLSPFVLPRKLATLSANDQDGARRPQSYFPRALTTLLYPFLPPRYSTPARSIHDFSRRPLQSCLAAIAVSKSADSFAAAAQGARDGLSRSLPSPSKHPSQPSPPLSILRLLRSLRVGSS